MKLVAWQRCLYRVCLLILPLYDDGTNGDMVADDGIYETDYLINSAEDINAVATATFVE